MQRAVDWAPPPASAERLVVLQGVEGWDVDLPTYLEASYIGTTAVKVMWLFCYILVYGIRPVLVRPKKVGMHPPPFLLDSLAHPRACLKLVGILRRRA